MSLYRGEKVLDGADFFTDSLPFYFNRVEETFDLQMHSHRFVEIVLVDEGEGFHFIDEEVVRVTKNDVFLLPAGTRHVFRPGHAGSRHPLIVYNCLFEPSKLLACLEHLPGFHELSRSRPYLFEGTRASSPGWLHLREGGSPWSIWFRAAYREFTERKPGYLLQLYSRFIELAVMLERHLERLQSNSAAEPENRFMEEVLRRIDKDYAMQLSAQSFAAATHLSERHFRRLFQQFAGCTFQEYVRSKRMERSRELLASTRLPVIEIMKRVGYTDKKHFLSLFKQSTGVSPTEYRRQASLDRPLEHK